MCVLLTWRVAAQSVPPGQARIGDEHAVRAHVRDGAEYTLPLDALVAAGRALFSANWTPEDGGGRPQTTGAGRRLADPAHPLDGARAFNRISGPDANSCQGCHNAPFGITGGKGDVVTNTFETAERFDFATFDGADPRRTGAADENGRPLSLQTIGRERATPALFGAGYVEMLARQMTVDLQQARDAVAPGQSRPLASKGVSFGTLARRRDGTWDLSRVEGLPAASLAVPRGGAPSLVLRPWNRGTAVSLRDVTNTSFNRHHGMQSTERFGAGVDADGDGVADELTAGDITAVAVFAATMPVPGRVVPGDPAAAAAAADGERLFSQIRCDACHVPSLALDRKGWIYSEPGPYNPPGNLDRAAARVLEIDLASPILPPPRLTPSAAGVIDVPLYSDLKLHDLGDGTGPMLTARLWGIGNAPPYFHHGHFTTMRQAVLAHGGEAQEQCAAFAALPAAARDALIEFLKTLQVLPPRRR
jgi:cytochrome c peroxidase